MAHPDAEMWWEAWNAYLTGRCIIKNSPDVLTEPSPEQQTIATLQRELEDARRERDALRETLRPFAGMCQVLDCRDMHDSNPTYVSVSLADGLFADDELVLTGEIDDDRPIVCANASARGFPGALVTGLVMGDFRRALSALSQPVQPVEDAG